MPPQIPENDSATAPTGESRAKTYTLAEGQTPTRLDRFLGEQLTLSRRQVRELLEGNLVRLNGQTAIRSDKGTMISQGDRVAVHPFVPIDQVFPMPDPSIKLEHIATGEGWVIINKPAGMPVRPHRADEVGTVLNALIVELPELAGVGEGGLRSGVVHRLDTDTSGLLIVATQPRAWLDLRRAFSEHLAKKTYRALVHGQLTGSQRMVKHLRVARSNDAIVEVFDQPAESGTTRQCAMTWTAIETFNSATLIDVDLETGFLHQVRAMMAHHGHPLVGDTRYGQAEVTADALRHMLHAIELEIGPIRARCDPPEDMREASEKQRETE